jgi:hypothetical protein
MTLPINPQNFAVPTAEQILAMLAAHLIGIDRWGARNLGAGIDACDVPFGSVFTVSEAEVVDHVLAQGWDARIVKPLDHAQPRTTGDWDVMFFAGRSAHGDWRALRPLDPERNSEPFDQQVAPSERAMVETIVRQLFETQRRFWG